MKVIDTYLAELIEDVHITKYGKYYFFKNLIISEIDEGVIYNWEAAQEIIDVIYEYYGENPSVSYISNRINKYSFVPTDWIKFYKSRHNFLNNYAVVTYSNKGLSNALLEKLFLKTKVQHFTKLHAAIDWVYGINSSINPIQIYNK